jgi:pyrroloquinoline quinone (PQQ) biosynthesis protein C
MTLSPTTGSAAPRLPSPAGPLSDALFEAFGRAPFALGRMPDPSSDDDLHLALYACYELGYVGFAGVDGGWEWEPSLVAVRAELERRFEAALLAAIDGVPDAPDGTVPERLQALIAADASPSVARHLAAHGTLEELRELLIHRSAYLLKEADPHVRTIPRLPGRAKAAMIEVLADEYGGGRFAYMHSELYRQALEAIGLDGAYGAHLERLPAVTLATVNLMSLFGAHARWRGAIAGHLAVTEMTSSDANRRYGRAVRRLGFTGREATHYFDEHVEADAVHDVVAAHDLAGGLAEAEPDQADTIVFGARALMLVEGAFARHLLGSWEDGRSSLR